MTREERLTAFRLRLQGGSWEWIGQQIGYSGKTVRDDLYRCLRRRPRQPNIRFPGLRRYVMEQCGGSVRLLSRRCGLSENTLYYALSTGKPSPETVSAILRATGKTYDALFGKE